MRPDEGSDELLWALGVTAEACGTPLSDGVLAIMVSDLRRYPETSVMSALVKCRLGLKGRLTLADIIERIDDGRPGAEQAWSMVSGATEATTLVLTDELAEVFANVSRRIEPTELSLFETDKVAARMAFVESYRRTVLTARAEGRPVRYRVSIGQDKAGRLPALREAVAKGQIKATDAAGYLPAHEAQTLTMSEAEARRVLQQGERRAATAMKALPAAAKAMQQGMPDEEIARRFAELAKSLEGPKRPPSKSIDWAAEERRLQEQREPDAG